MEVYSRFAQVYDLFMDNVPYEEWAAYLAGELKGLGISEGIILDLGCGTGAMTRELKKYGYDMIGVDYSEEMLSRAMTKDSEGILYLCQDMKELDLYGTVRGVISVCDCLNYLLEEEELLKVFQLVNLYLDPGGVFIFDMNTPYKYEIQLGDRTFAESRPEGSFIWENTFDKEQQLNEYDLTLFVEDETDGRYDRYDEVHVQRSYSRDQVEALIQQAGLELVQVYQGYSREPAGATSERWTFITKERGKANE